MNRRPLAATLVAALTTTALTTTVLSAGVLSAGVLSTGGLSAADAAPVPETHAAATYARKAAAPSATPGIAGEQVEVTGSVPAPTGARKVTLQQSTGDAWVVASSARTTKKGGYRFIVTQPATAASFRVVAKAKGGARKVTSKPSTITPLAQSLAVAAPAQVAPGAAVTVKVTATPARAGRPVLLEAVGTPTRELGRAVTDAKGVAALTFVAPASGPVPLRATAVGHRGASAVSGTASVGVLTRDPSHRLVSVSTTGGVGNEGSEEAETSADGRYVVFRSFSGNLVDLTTSSQSNVFLRDTVAGTTTLVSKAANGGRPNGESASPSISADGRYVAFQSYASNLVAGDTNKEPDVFLYDRSSGAVTLVSHQPGSPTLPATGWSAAPAISPNGSYITFTTVAPELSKDGRNQAQVVRYDRTTTATRLISYAFNQGFAANASSWDSAVDDAGNVVLRSDATDLGPTDTNGRTDLYYFRSDNGSFSNLTHASSWDSNGGFDLAAGSTGVVFSTTGKLQPDDVDLAEEDVYLWRPATGVLALLTTGDGSHTDPRISDDGRHVLYTDHDDAARTATVRLRDTVRGTTTVVPAPPFGPPGTAKAVSAALSGDGRWGYYVTSDDGLVGQPAQHSGQLVGHTTGVNP